MYGRGVPRLGIIVLSLFAVAVCAPSAAAATSCKQLRGHDLLEGGSLTVVDQRSRSATGRLRHRYLACRKRGATAGGRPLVLRASRSGGRLTLLDSRGAKLAVRDAATGAVTLWDVLARTRRRLADGGAAPTGGVVIADSGEAAAVFGRGPATSVIGFDLDGTRYRLDRGAIARRSLRHGTGYAVSWTSGGTRRRADLTAPAVPCASLAGSPVLRTAELNVVRVRYRTDFLEGELDGRVDRLRACALSGGPVRVLGERAVSDQVPGGDGFELMGTAGVFTLERDSVTSEEAFQHALFVRDVGSGRRTALWGNGDARGPHTELGEDVERAVVAPGGQVGVLFQVPGAGGGTDQQVVGFSVAGAPRVLERAPAGQIDQRSISFAGSVLRWTRNGEQHTADLAAP